MSILSDDTRNRLARGDLWNDDGARTLAIVDAAEKELAEAHALIARQAAILTGVANALRGEPPPLKTHSHHDLAERAAEVAERARAHGRVVIATQEDNARLRTTARVLYLVAGEHSTNTNVTGDEYAAAMAHGAELEAGR